MYNNILVPLDGSERAEAILPHVIELAQRLGSQLMLLRVVDPTTSYTGLEGLPIDVMRDIVNEQAAEAQQYLDAKAGELKAQNINTKAIVRYGPISQTILNVAQAESADLIALASHGRTGLARIFYGSVAAGVLNKADRPLLLIRSVED